MTSYDNTIKRLAKEKARTNSNKYILEQKFANADLRV